MRRLGAIAGLCALAAGCAAPFAPAVRADGRLTLSCIVRFEVVNASGQAVSDDSVRTLWLDLNRGLYALSELGETRVDDEWAAALEAVRAEHGGLVPAARRSGGFICLTIGADGQCVHGVDLERRLYAFANPVAEGGGAALSQMRGRGRCAPATDIPWPAYEQGAAL